MLFFFCEGRKRHAKGDPLDPPVRLRQRLRPTPFALRRARHESRALGAPPAGAEPSAIIQQSA